MYDRAPKRADSRHLGVKAPRSGIDPIYLLTTTFLTFCNARAFALSALSGRPLSVLNAVSKLFSRSVCRTTNERKVHLIIEGILRKKSYRGRQTKFQIILRLPNFRVKPHFEVLCSFSKVYFLRSLNQVIEWTFRGFAKLHGYLIWIFLSRAASLRQDAYLTTMRHYHHGE